MRGFTLYVVMIGLLLAAVAASNPKPPVIAWFRDPDARPGPNAIFNSEVALTVSELTGLDVGDSTMLSGPRMGPIGVRKIGLRTYRVTLWGQ